jgi:hypothetical protein
MADAGEPLPLRVEANSEMSRTVSSWPAGHCAVSAASAMGRRSSNTASHVRQRNS